MGFDKTILEGNSVRLEPLSTQHRSGLCNAIQDGELWKLFVTLVPHPKDIDAFFDDATQMHAAGNGLAYAIVDKASNTIAGSTRFMNANVRHNRVEIGFTFLGKSFQRSTVNAEAKLLLLTHAFEVLKLNRVEFLTDYLNDVSRNAILRLGAKQEGILRNHMTMPNGRIRDSVLFSIVAHEWPGVKQNLMHKITK